MELASFQLKSSDTFGPKSIMKNILVFLTASLFKVLAISIIGVFFKVGTLFIFMGYDFVLCVCLLITRLCYNLKWERGQMWESVKMSWLTITNLGRGKDASHCRLVSTLYWTIAHTITLSVILDICNTDPTIVNADNFEFGEWAKLPLVQDLTSLNILLVSTLCLGWGALVLDVITAAVKKCRSKDSDTEDQEEKASFWDGAILLEGLKYKCCS